MRFRGHFIGGGHFIGAIALAIAAIAAIVGASASRADAAADPARLHEYAKIFNADPEWQHYTGTLAASQTVQRALDVYRGTTLSDRTPPSEAMTLEISPAFLMEDPT